MEHYGTAEEIDIFKFITNSGLSWEELGITFAFNNCEWNSTTSGWIGGGHGNGRANYSWTMTMDSNYWFKGYTSVTVKSSFRLNACMHWDSFGTYRSTAQGGIGVVPLQGDATWSNTSVWQYRR
ncbi:MAG: hypothetical protein HFJ33_07685 [Clostridia bacterium]|nr:hypothetical protein [Clostridia bacterium]